MTGFARRVAGWVGRHAFPAAAAGVLIAGAAGGGIGYAVAGGSTASAAPVTAGLSPQPSAAATKHKKAHGPAAVAVQQALRTLAKDTGKSVATIRSELKAGQSIDQIAGAQAPAVESAWLAGIQKLADRAVAAGRITPAAEQTDLAAVKSRLDALMAEPGNQLLKDVRAALGFLRAGAKGHGAAASPSASAGG